MGSKEWFIQEPNIPIAYLDFLNCLEIDYNFLFNFWFVCPGLAKLFNKLQKMYSKIPPIVDPLQAGI